MVGAALAGCSGSSTSVSGNFSFRESDGMFSGGLLFHGSQIPPLYATMSIADVYGEDGIGDLILVARERRPTGFGEGAFLMQGEAGGGFGEPVELGQRALDAPAIADFDGDGHLDLVFARFEVEIYFGNGDGTFDVAEVDPLPTGRVRTPLTGDFDNDGDPDFVVSVDDEAAVDRYTIAVYLNRGNGVFDRTMTALSDGFQLAGPPADFNGDDALDLAAIISGTTLVWIEGNADGTFGTPITLRVEPILLSSAITGDVNADGNPDIVSLDSNLFSPVPGTDFVSHLSRGNGTFDEILTTGFDDFGQVFWLVLDDVTGDAVADMLVHNGLVIPSAVNLVKGAGNGSFVVPQTPLLTGAVLSSLTGDFSADGIKDIYARGLIEALPGGGFYRDPIVGASVGAEWVAAMDIYQDGSPDFILGDYRDLQVVVPRGDGSFVESEALPFPEPYSVFVPVPPITRAGDLQGDGLPDLVLLEPSYFPLTPLPTARIMTAQIQYDTTLEFTPFVSLGVPILNFSDLVDLDGDGVLDFTGREVLAPTSGFDINPGPGWALFGNGDGTFGDGVPVTAEPTHMAPAAVDLNGDGLKSLVVGQVDTPLLHIYHVGGDRSVSFSESIAISDDEYQIAVGRLDSDGFDDFVLFERIPANAMRLSLYYGNSSNSVDAGQQINVGTRRPGQSVHIVHLDGDGVPYVVIDGVDNNALIGRSVTLVLRRTGPREFTLLPEIRTYAGISGPFVLGDFNLDGQPDVITLAGNTLQVLRGRGGGEFEFPLYFDVDPIASNLLHGDYDSDGDLDVALFRADTPSISLKMNRIFP
jgi:hypothetical protein